MAKRKAPNLDGQAVPPETARPESAWERRGPCGWPGCAERGLVRQRTVDGWLNLCRLHYEAWWMEHYREARKHPSDSPAVRAVREAMKGGSK